MAAKTRLTLEEFECLTHDGMLHELNEGEFVSVTHPKFRHTRIAHRLQEVLSGYLQAKPTGEIFLEAGCLLRVDPPTLRVPDVSYLSADRIRQAPLDEYVEGTPELAVEIVSPSDSAEDLDQKVMQYLAAGSLSVWVFCPRTRKIHIHRAHSNPLVVEENQFLEAPELFPGWSVRVSDLL